MLRQYIDNRAIAKSKNEFEVVEPTGNPSSRRDRSVVATAAMRRVKRAGWGKLARVAGWGPLARVAGWGPLARVAGWGPLALVAGWAGAD